MIGVMRHAIPARDEIKPDTPLRLSVAVERAFPGFVDGVGSAAGRNAVR